MLFGDELQAQLTAIRALNRISHTAVSHNSGSSLSSKPSWHQKQDKRFLGKGQYQPKWKQKPWKKKKEPSKKINEDFTSKLNSLQVTDFVGFVHTVIAYLVAQTSCFKSGRLAQFIPAWQQITSDTEILQMVSGQYIEFSTQASQTHPPPGKRFGGEEQVIITSEISNLLEKAVIVETIHEPGEFISSVFV